MIRERGISSLIEALKPNTTLNALDLSSEDKRKTHQRHPSTIHTFHFSFHQQGVELETQKQHHWVNH